MAYDNRNKDEARRWAWNRICERIPNVLRKKARVYTLIGDTTLELEVALSKGFSDINVIGVDVREEPVQRWREAGGLAIQAPIAAVVAFSKVKPQGVIADFCSGISVKNFNSFTMAFARTAIPGCVVINMLRGRDEVNKFRGQYQDAFLESVGEDKLIPMARKRSVLLLHELFQRLCKREIAKFFEPIDALNLTPVEQLALAMGSKYSTIFDRLFREFSGKLNPQFYEYQSQDSNQWFDTLAINAIVSPDDCLPPRLLDDELWECDVQVVKRRLAALEAVRTMRLNELGERKRRLFE